MGRPTRHLISGLALAFALGVATGCGSTAATPSPSITSAPTSTSAPTATPVPVPSALTPGYEVVEDAIKAWLFNQGLTYSGDCETGTREEGTYCSTLNATVAGGSIYLTGPINSEAAAWMLLRRVGGLWYVIAVSPVNETTAPPADWV